MILALLTACWQPETFVAPPPAQVEASDVLAGTADQIRPGVAEEGAGAAEEGAGAADGAAEEGAGEGAEAGEGAAAKAGEGAAAEAGAGEAPGAAGEAAAEAPPTDVPVEPYVAHTVGRPITIVGDDGAPLQVITAQGAKVTVLAEGPERVKVHCHDCRPEVEGWLQKRVVAR